MEVDAKTRVHVGNFFGALIPAVGLSIESPGLGVTLTEPSTVAVWAAILYLPSLAFTAVLSLSSFYVLDRFHLIRWWSISICGFIGGAFTGWTMVSFRMLQSDIPSLILFSGLGTATAFVVWLFWRSAAAQQTTQERRAQENARAS
jgi:hypothetical protein